MTCSNCGTELKDGYKFCLKCGTPVKNQVDEVKEVISGTNEDMDGNTAENSRSLAAQEKHSDMDGLEEKLIKLHDLFTKELIDSDEYKKMKAKLLGL